MPLFEFNDYTSRSKINVTLFFVYWFVYKITQFVQLAGIQLTIQRSPKNLFRFLIIHLDFVLADVSVIFEGMSVLGGTTVFRYVVLLGSIIFS